MSAKILETVDISNNNDYNYNANNVTENVRTELKIKTLIKKKIKTLMKKYVNLKLLKDNFYFHLLVRQRLGKIC